MKSSLNERFKAFISQLPLAEVIDDLDLPAEFNEKRRADFLIENRKAIIELKSLESDQEPKIHAELEKHRKRDEYPLFYGEMELYKILKHLPDGKQIQRRLFERISRSIEQSFREADKQIGATKEMFACPDAFGFLVLLNHNISVLSPEVISKRVSQLLTKIDDDGSPHYKNITRVWIILENFSLKTKKRAKILPLIMVDGIGDVDQTELTRIIEMLTKKWAEFDNMPLYVTPDIKRISDSDFIRPSELEKELQQVKPRYEIWREQYRQNPYLRSLSDQAVLMHGSRLLHFMTPNFLKDGIDIPFDKMAQYMEGWTHFLEETNFRGLDLKKVPKVEFS